jgi:hypothetical protein
MAINSAVNIDINVDGTSTVKEAAKAVEGLGDKYSDAQKKAEELALSKGLDNKETQEAIRLAGKYKGQLEKLDFAIEGAKGGTQGLYKASQAVVGGFEAAAGVAAIFGGESEELEKALIKVQGAMALSQGLADFKEFSPALKDLGKTVTGPLTSAFKNFGKTVKGTVASTGIGLLVIAVGTLVAYWDDIKAAVSGVSEEQKKLLRDQQASTALAQEQLDSISAQENILRQQGATEQEILNMKIMASKQLIKNLELDLLRQESTKQGQIDAAKRNQEITEGILKFLNAPITILLKAVDALTAGLKEIGVLDEATNLEGKFTKSLASLLFDPDEVEKNANDSIAETKKQITKLKNDVAGYEMTVTKIKKDEVNKRQEIENKYYEDRLNRIKRDNEDELSEYEKLNELLLSIEVEKLNERGKNLDAEILLLEDKYKKELELAKGNAQKIFFIEQRRLIELQQLRKKYDDITDNNIQSVFEKRQADNNRKKAVELRREEIFQQKIADSYNAINNLANTAQAFISNASTKLDEDFQNRIERLEELGYTEEQIANMRDKELQNIDKRAKKAFELEKALRYTQTLLSTIEGVQSAFTTANKSPLTAVFPAYPYIQATAAGAFGLAQLQQISRSQYKSKMTPSTKGGGVPNSSPGVPQLNAPRLQSTLNADNQLFSERRVYVTESDITTTQKKVATTQKVSLVE